MRYFLFTIGILLVPSSAFAQIDPPPSALSPWVRAVIDRSESGIQMADELTYNNCNIESVMSEFFENQDLLTKATDVSIDLGYESQLLFERTVCFDHDRAVLKKQMKKIADALKEKTLGCEVGSGDALRENYNFLLQAYRDLLQGGVDPSFESELLIVDWRFHKRELWNAGTVQKKREESEIQNNDICPFTSDYGPHSYAEITVSGSKEKRSFGCDASILSEFPEPYEREATVLKEFIESVTEMSRSIYQTVQEALSAQERVKSLRSSGSTPPPLPPEFPPPPEHATVSGCVRPEEPITEDPEVIEAILLTYPDFFEKRNYQNETFSPAPEQVLPLGLLFRPLTDYFSTTPNTIALLRAFEQLRQTADARRELPPSFLETMYDNYFSFIFHLFVPAKDLRLISSNINRELAYIDASNRDSIEQMRDAVDPLKKAVASLIDVTQTTLAEKYVPELTYFLARSCVDGHCQETLKTVAQRNFNPYCRPYVSGKYTEEDAYKKCYCDPLIQGSWSEWDTYCSESFSPSAYSGRRDPIAPICLE